MPRRFALFRSFFVSFQRSQLHKSFAFGVVFKVEKQLDGQCFRFWPKPRSSWQRLVGEQTGQWLDLAVQLSLFAFRRLYSQFLLLHFRLYHNTGDSCTYWGLAFKKSWMGRMASCAGAMVRAQTLTEALTFTTFEFLFFAVVFCLRI